MLRMGTLSPASLESAYRKRPIALTRKSRRVWYCLAICLLFCVWFLRGRSPLSPFDGLWDEEPSIDAAAETKIQTDKFWAAVKSYYPLVGIPKFEHSKTLVVAAKSNVNLNWLDTDLSDVEKAIYRVDDPTAPLHPPKNKGREAMVYLTYIIDHYDNLPDVVLFFHSDRLTWHNSLLLNFDTVHMIKRLSTDRVVRNGYMNARCDHFPGCPNWIRFDRPKKEYDMHNKPEEPFFTKQMWHDLHGADEPIPESLSQPCSAQFAVSRDAIHRHPKSKYIHMRQWLLDTKYEDLLSGRVFEYSWQYIFTGKGEFCPTMSACYCDGYGVCFKDDDEFKDWKQDYDSLDTLERELWKMDHGFHDQSTSIWLTVKETIANVHERLNETKTAAFLRGQDLKVRAKFAEMG